MPSPHRYGAVEGGPGSQGKPRAGRHTLARGAVLAVCAGACVSLAVVGLLSTRTAGRAELASDSAIVSKLAADLVQPGGPSALLKHVKASHALKQQLAAAEGAVQTAVEEGEGKDKIKELEAKAATAKKKLEDAQAEADHAESALVHAAGGDTPAIEQPLFFSAKTHKAPRQEKGFISGDRLGEHHVFTDYGINHKRRRGNWMQRHFGDWINTADGRKQYVCDYYDDPYETGTHRRIDVIDNEWCDDQYYGYHYPVHYHDDREVYNNGYGEHLGTVYGDDGVKPGVLHKMVHDYYGDFFHGLSPGYDWVEEHNRNNEQPSITQYAYSTDKDKTYGDEGDKRQRPLYYMDWDEDGTRALDHTKTFGEEDFMSQGGDFAVKPHGKRPLKDQKLALLRKEKAEAHKLEEEVKEQKLDLEVKKLQGQVASARMSIHKTIENTMSRQQQQQRVQARRATLRRRHLTKHAQQRVAKAHVQQLSAEADSPVQATDVLDAAVGSVEASLGVKARAVHPEARAPRARGSSKKLTLKQARQQMRERMVEETARHEARAQHERAWLKNQLAHGTGSWTLRALQAAEHKREMQQALSLRQDREGELARENMGRAHGCYIQQVTGATAMLDDCDPLEEKMQPAIEAESQRLAEATEGNLGGVHWTSGDVPYNYDAFPMREAHGGYSGLSDIAFPADAVSPTLYQPTVGLGPGDFAKAVGTRAKGPAALRERGHAREGEEAEAHAAQAVEKTKKAVVAKETREDDKLQAQEQAVDAALRKEHKEEAVAATDKAIADKVMADAQRNEDEEKRTRLLKAATAEYQKAAEATRAAKQTAEGAARAPASASTEPRQEEAKDEAKGGKQGVSVTVPASMATGSVTISFSNDGGKAGKEHKKAYDAMEVARKLVETENKVANPASVAPLTPLRPLAARGALGVSSWCVCLGLAAGVWARVRMRMRCMLLLMRVVCVTWPGEQVREQAKALAARENAKTAAVVAQNKELNKALARIVPRIAEAKAGEGEGEMNERAESSRQAPAAKEAIQAYK